MISRIYILNLLAVIVLSVILFTENACAASQEIGATLNSRLAISLSNVHNMNFGNVEFAPVHSAILQLGTDGALTVNGTGIEVSSGYSAGSLDVSSDGVSPMEISCNATGSLGGPAGKILAIQNTEVSTAPAAFGAGNKCNGVGTASLTLVAGSLTVYVGGEANIASNTFENGIYDTSTIGGSPITINIVYQ